MATELELALSAEGVRAASLARALDEEDRFGEILETGERQELTRRTFEGVTLEDHPDRKAQRRLAKALEERGRLVSELLEPRLDAPFFASTRRPALLPALLIGAALVGLFSNVLGPEKAISVLAPPLLGLIAWNLGLFLFLTLGALRSAIAPRAATGRLDWVIRRALPKTEKSGLESRIMRRHLKTWLPAILPLERVRWAGRLHLAAAVMVAATVAGMYLRGLAFEYRATWESTFLEAEALDPWLKGILAPALRLQGVALPELASLQAPESGPAAPWIHAWALTAVMLVILPRLFLAAWALLRSAGLERRLTLRLSKAYLRRLIAGASTTPHEVQVVPYSYRPKEKAAETLRRLLLDFLGARANLRFTPTVAYGDEIAPSSAGWRVLVFSLSQTPEVEVHGELLGELGEELADGQKLLVLVDEAPFLEKVPDSQRLDRRESRRRAWLRNLEVSARDGTQRSNKPPLPQPIFLTLDDSLEADRALDILSRGVWPPEGSGQSGARWRDKGATSGA